MERIRLVAAVVAVMVVIGNGTGTMAQVNPSTGTAAALEERLKALEAEVKELRGELGRQKAAQADVRPATAPVAASVSADAFNDLDQRHRILERKWELAQEAQDAKDKTTPKVIAGKSGFGLESPDGEFTLKLRGYVHADGQFFLNDNGENNEFTLRRARPYIEGSLWKFINYRIMPDFGGGTSVLQDAYIDLVPSPRFGLQAGKFKAPFGLERLQSATRLTFVERGLPTNLVPNRDLGVMAHGLLWDGLVEYGAGVFDGARDGGSLDGDEDDGKDGVARLFVLPFKSLGNEALSDFGVGLAGSLGEQEGGVPSYKTPGQETFFSYRSGVRADGNRYRLSPQGYYYYGPFVLYGEYVWAQHEAENTNVHEQIENDAWQVAASWMLTGEKNSWKGITPLKPFAPSQGQWGAFELAARYNELSVDDSAFDSGLANPATAAEEARSWSVGVNWHLNKNLKVQLSYDQTEFDGGSESGDRDTEQFLGSRLQVAF